ncbi:choice-of-anchor V domain-containing protein [Lewinella sp. 4G2]|uniref:choice-of-anchor V domain-containing protein n=1 Tax=Lewinella sp. 4G2 TaxID=1803372 RepID=UPI0007B4C3A7|nr:choice-of-anchor V domain-containing protein [Lewinella sp. 4G2]OAV46020.1 hypothetical protein A3850_017255 [Lewinella sp. 4G2]
MNKNIYTYLLLAGGLLACVTFLGNSRGAASAGNYYTGAPSAAGGTEGTCSTCHRSGSFGEPSLELLFADAGSDDFAALTAYEPGKEYQVKLAVGYMSDAPAGYGFQTQILTSGANPTTAGTLTASGPVRISNGPNGSGRRYAEQSQISNDSSFVFSWTAPDAGTGAVDIYSVGNLVNRAQGMGGDNGSSSPLITALAEGQPSGVNNLVRLSGALFPNPLRPGQAATLRVDVLRSGDYQLQVTDLAGRILTRSDQYLATGSQTLNLNVASLVPGVYVVSLQSGADAFVQRLVVE